MFAARRAHRSVDDRVGNADPAVGCPVEKYADGGNNRPDRAAVDGPREKAPPESRPERRLWGGHDKPPASPTKLSSAPRSGVGPYQSCAWRSPRGYRQSTAASIAAMSSSERPKWWPISCTSTWVMMAPSDSSCSAQ